MGRQKMRLKQVLGVILLLVGAAFAATGPQLTKISVAGQEQATTVVLEASGAFTHTEYRPTDNLLLVDLPGVEAGKWKDSAEMVNRPGVDSYRVVSYTGSNGAEVTRVEMRLANRAEVSVGAARNTLRVRVQPNSGVV